MAIRSSVLSLELEVKPLGEYTIRYDGHVIESDLIVILLNQEVMERKI